MQSQVRDMVWEVDDKSEVLQGCALWASLTVALQGYLTLDSISALLKRLQKAKIRGVGTGEEQAVDPNGCMANAWGVQGPICCATFSST